MPKYPLNDQSVSAFIAVFAYCGWHGIGIAETPNPSMAKALNSYKKFVAMILDAGRVPHSAAMLALYYIDLIRILHPRVGGTGSPGSECRILVSALMLAMKFLVDNTYTNKTWHRISSIPLVELYASEFELLALLDYRLHMDAGKYSKWLLHIKTIHDEYQRIYRARKIQSSIDQRLLLVANG